MPSAFRQSLESTSECDTEPNCQTTTRGKTTVPASEHHEGANTYGLGERWVVMGEKFWWSLRLVGVARTARLARFSAFAVNSAGLDFRLQPRQRPIYPDDN